MKPSCDSEFYKLRRVVASHNTFSMATALGATKIAPMFEAAKESEYRLGSLDTASC